MHPDEVVVVDDDPANIDMPDKQRNPASRLAREGHGPALQPRFMDGTMRIVEELCGLVDLDAEGEGEVEEEARRRTAPRAPARV